MFLAKSMPNVELISVIDEYKLRRQSLVTSCRSRTQYAYSICIFQKRIFFSIWWIVEVNELYGEPIYLNIIVVIVPLCSWSMQKFVGKTEKFAISLVGNVYPHISCICTFICAIYAYMCVCKSLPFLQQYAPGIT